MSAAVLDRVWDGAGDAWTWLRGVLLGEWQDHRSISQVVTDALTGFVPGVGSIVTLRDLIAVIVRLAKHPEKREEVSEWILLIAMLLPLVITVIGAAAAGVGALVGAELGAFLRAAALFVVKEGGVAIKAIVEFFQAHGYGHVVNALKEVKFAKYRQQLLTALNEQLDKLIRLTRAFEQRLRALNPQSLPSWLPGRDKAISAIEHCVSFVQQLEALRRAAIDMIPKALIEMDRRLGALLAGDLKAATQVTHSVQTGVEAPAVHKLTTTAAPAPAVPRASPGLGSGGKPPARLKNPEPPQPGNTRRAPERVFVQLKGQREYAVVDKAERPVGAKPYKAGETVMEHLPVKERDWDRVSHKVSDGWPNMHREYMPGRWSSDYDTFSGALQASSIPAGSPDKLVRIVSHDAGPGANGGAFWNRALANDGEDLRAASAVKDSWNKNGEFVELTVPPPGHPIWKELHELRVKAAGTPVPYAEELKFWEGPAASQVYKKKIDGKEVDDAWYLAGGKPQQFFDRSEMALLNQQGFIGPRKPTNFADFDKRQGNIVPKDGVFLEVVPLNQAVPPAPPKTGKP